MSNVFETIVHRRQFDRSAYRGELWWDGQTYGGQWDGLPRHVIREAIIDGCAAVVRRTAQEFVGEGRQCALVAGRHLACHFLVRGLAMSYLAAGRRLNRDHSSIIHGVQSVEKWSPATQILAAEAAGHIGAIIDQPGVLERLRKRQSRATISVMARDALNSIESRVADVPACDRPVLAAIALARHALSQLEDVARAHDH